MFFPDQQIQVNKPQPEKILLFYENSSIDKKPTELRLTKKNMTFKEISKALNMNPLRLFNSEGAQYFEDDLAFIKNKTVLYASRGQQFDPASCLGEYEMLQKLGEGGFGKVFLAQHKQTGQKYAIKIIKTDKISSAGEIDSIFSEVEVLKTLKHQNIVKVHNCLTLKNMEVAIVMEYLGGGELLKLMQKQIKLNQERAKTFIKQIIKGMVYCHQHNLIHRDLKLENVLLVNKQEDKIKIIDFGIAGVMNSMTWEDMDTGSLTYMAPECFINSKNYKVDGRIDVWAVGVILYSMITGDMPFRGNTTMDTVEAIKIGKCKIAPEVQKRVSKDCIDLINQCLTIDSKTRPTMEQLTEHPWIAPKVITEESLQKMKEEEFPVTEQEIKVGNLIKAEQIDKPKSLKSIPKKTIIPSNLNSNIKSKPVSKAFK